MPSPDSSGTHPGQTWQITRSEALERLTTGEGTVQPSGTTASQPPARTILTAPGTGRPQENCTSGH